MKKQTFKQYLTNIGDEAAAELFGVKARTIKSWRLGYRSPRAKNIPDLVEKSGGKLGYDSFRDLGGRCDGNSVAW